MATPAEIAALRLLVNEPDNVEPYTDAALGGRLDAASGDGNLVAYQIWTEKAATTADLVDISEAGSSRKMGDLHEQALGMAKHFAGLVSGGGPTEGVTRVVRLRR